MTAYRILVVDDLIDNLRATISIIEKHHPEYLIYQANKGKTALHVSELRKPDIIISDWEMPEMNGIELIRALQADPGLKNIPVIITTGVMVSSDDLKTALQEGAVDYLLKPVNSTELLARMHAAITISSYQKQLIQEKERKIVENAIITNQINDYLIHLAEFVREVKSGTGKKAHIDMELDEVISKIENKIDTNSWQRFTLAFNELHPDFEKRMIRNHPSMTPAEIKLSTLIRLGFKIKELAELMFVTPESMRVSRSRLRKKLGLKASQNLHSYLSSI